VISSSTIVMHYSIASCLEKYNANLQFSEMDVHFSMSLRNGLR